MLGPRRREPDGRSLFIVSRTQPQEIPTASTAVDVPPPLFQNWMVTAAAST
ncbi:MAG TPA: hypothetical protein VKW04_06020 [Planctomycetota bacterium]|nr:hypothetical protein [Planctomycetota bacterium]